MVFFHSALLFAPTVEVNSMIEWVVIWSFMVCYYTFLTYSLFVGIDEVYRLRLKQTYSMETKLPTKSSNRTQKGNY